MLYSHFITRAVSLSSLFFLSLSMAFTADASKHTIMVAPFENLSQAKAMVTYEAATSPDTNSPKRTFTVDRYSEAPRGVLEDILTKQSGLTVIERQRVDSILQEQQFSGLSDPKQATLLGKMVGAQYIVMGTVQDVAARVKEFNGYGVAVRNTVVTASVRVRVIDLETGAVVASATLEGSEAFTASQFGGTADSDVAYKVITAALRKIKDDAEFMNKITGKTPTVGDVVEVSFAPTPNNSDILIDGVFVGTSPSTVPMTPNKAVKVTIRHSGYAEWENTVMPRAGLKVSPELTEKSER